MDKYHNNDIVIIGNGHVGNWLKKHFCIPDEHHITSNLKDLTPKALETLYKKSLSGIRMVVNTAAKTDMVWCENNPEQCYINNTLYPVNLAKNMNEVFGPIVHFVHISSGCLWQGPYTKDNRPFTPETPTAPACVYTHCKALADQIIMQENPYATILRPRLVYSSEVSPRNLLHKLTKYPKLINIPNSITSVKSIAHTINELNLGLKSCFCNGILHVYDKGVVTPYIIGVMLAEQGLCPYPKAIPRDEMIFADRPKPVDVVLYDETFEQFIEPLDVFEELNQTIAAYKEKVCLPSAQ